MGYQFPADTVEGSIERTQKAIFRNHGLDADECFRYCVEQVSTQKIDPPDFGDIVLEKAGEDSQVRAWLERLAKEGAMSENVRFWYNMHVLERACMLNMTDTKRGAAWLGLLRQGLSADDATINVFKFFARYGDPGDPEWGGPVRARLSHEDRPLPIELYPVVEAFVAVQSKDPAFCVRCRKASSLNAVIREEMATGRLYETSPDKFDLGTGQDLPNQSGCLLLAVLLPIVSLAAWIILV